MTVDYGARDFHHEVREREWSDFEARKQTDPKAHTYAQDAQEVAWELVVVGERLNRHLPACIEALEQLVAGHQVEMMQLPLDTFRLLDPVAREPDLWLRHSHDAVMDEVRRRRAAKDARDFSHTFPERLTDVTLIALRRLRDVADRHRRAPHDADTVDTTVREVQFGATRASPRQVDALEYVARLHDLLGEHLVGPPAP